jgi:DNA-binding transcriptional ArsR family regulator
MVLPWTKIPTHWIRDENDPGLRKFIRQTRGASISALVIYVVLSLRCNSRPDETFDDVGCAKVSYSEFQRITGLSRPLISAGLKLLVDLGLIKLTRPGRSNTYQIEDYNKAYGWAKVPKKHLYGSSSGEIRAFHNLNLRHDAELNALKLYLLLIAFRSNDLNYAMIGYENITKYTGIQKNHIKSAQSLLTCWNLIQVDPETTPGIDKVSQPFKYRICGIDGRRHMGTQKRDVEAEVA